MTTWLAGDTDVDVGIEMALGTLVACGSVNQALACRWALACHWPVIGLSLACRCARARGQEDFLWHHGRPLGTKRNSRGPRFHVRNEGNSDFTLRASGRHPCVGPTEWRLVGLRRLLSDRFTSAKFTASA